MRFNKSASSSMLNSFNSRAGVVKTTSQTNTLIEALEPTNSKQYVTTVSKHIKTTSKLKQGKDEQEAGSC